jgi:hypothetical protein
VLQRARAAAEGHTGRVVVPQVVPDEVGRRLRVGRQVALPEVVVGAGGDQVAGAGVIRGPCDIDRVDDRTVLDPGQLVRVLRRLACLAVTMIAVELASPWAWI